MHKLFILSVLALSISAFAQNFDEPIYEVHKLQSFKEKPELIEPPRILKSDKNSTQQSDVVTAISYQNKVLQQGARGTCSYFATLSALESLLIQSKAISPGASFSEQYLSYTAKLYDINNDHDLLAQDGSTVTDNVAALNKYGIVYSADDPYNDVDWSDGIDSKLSADQLSLRNLACPAVLAVPEGIAKVVGQIFNIDWKKICYNDQRDLNADNPFAQKSAMLSSQFNLPDLTFVRLGTDQDIRAAIDQFIPVYLNLEFFYAAWNYSTMKSYGLGEANISLYKQGIVNTPTQNDITESRKHGCRHGLLVVGYDDKTSSFIIKNSWGTNYWGSQFTINGVNYPGYGRVPYDYALNYGSFSKIQFKQ